MNSLSKRLNGHFASCAAVAAAAVAASAASAQVVWHTYGENGIQVPANGDGRYFNLLTGATGTSGSAVGGGPWMNPYGSGTGNIFWYATSAGGSWRGVNIGGYANEVSNLGLGFTVGSNIPNSGAAGTPQFNTLGGTSWADGLPGDFSLNALNYFGFRFQVGTATHYGFGVMRIGANLADRYMMGFAFESTAGASITTTAVPAPGALALLGAAGLMGSRRRRAA
jgi:hypothetical protein